MLAVFVLVLAVLASVVLISGGDVGSSVGIGQCWLLAVAVVVAFVLVHAGVCIDPFFLLIGVPVCCRTCSHWYRHWPSC